MNVKEIRRLNLLGLCNLSSREAVAEKVGYEDTNYFNQLLSPNITRTNIGDRTAKKIEDAFGYEAGWMDLPHPELWPEDEERNVPDMTNDNISSAYNVAPPSIQEAVRLLLSVEQK